MKTITSITLHLFVIVSILAIIPIGARREERSNLGEVLPLNPPTRLQKKTQDDANAIKLKDGSPVGGFSLSARIMQKDPESKEKKDFDLKEKGRPLILGKTVYLVTKLVNISRDTLIFFETDPEMNFRIEILNSKGNQVPRTPYGLQLLIQESNSRGMFYRRIAHRIPPGEALPFKLDLSRQFDLSHTGTYSVQVSCKVLKKPGAGLAELKSNVVVFELEQTK